jgi:phage gp36-like protein
MRPDMDLLVSEFDLELQISAAKVIQLADDDGDQVADEEVIEAVCTKASALINDMLEPMYSGYVPFAEATCPAILKHLARDIAAFELYARRNNVPEIVQYRYEWALQKLKEYASGKLPLITETPLVQSVADDIESSTAFTDRVFTRETLAGYCGGFQL